MELREKHETSGNSMVMAVKTHSKRYELKKTGNEKNITAQWELFRQCYESGYSKEDLRVLLKFINWLIRLQEGLGKPLSKKRKIRGGI
jgi:hypothetical protein